MKFAALCLVIGSVALAANESSKKEADPFDMTALQKRMEESGVPTPALVQQLEANATALARESKWQQAADANDTLAKTANWLANIISAGVQPFYNASYDDQKGYSIKDSDLKFETLSNHYKDTRNRALVAQAECYMQLKDQKRAVVLLVRALELINVKDAEWWARARKDLYGIVQVSE